MKYLIFLLKKIISSWPSILSTIFFLSYFCNNFLRYKTYYSAVVFLFGWLLFFLCKFLISSENLSVYITSVLDLLYGSELSLLNTIVCFMDYIQLLNSIDLFLKRIFSFVCSSLWVYPHLDFYFNIIMSVTKIYCHKNCNSAFLLHTCISQEMEIQRLTTSSEIYLPLHWKNLKIKCLFLPKFQR